MGLPQEALVWDVCERLREGLIAATVVVGTAPVCLEEDAVQGDVVEGFCYYCSTPKGESYITAQMSDQPVLVAASESQRRMWERGLVARPCTFRFQARSGWKPQSHRQGLLED